MSIPSSDQKIEHRLREMAATFSYPPTPDVAGSVRNRLAQEAKLPFSRVQPIGSRRRFPAVAAALSIALAATILLAVPEARALVGSFLIRIGSIEVVLATPTPLPYAATPLPTPSSSATFGSLNALSLDAARSNAGFPVQLPRYPADLGNPDRAYLQDLGGPAALFVWAQPGQPGQTRLILYEMSSSAYAQKSIVGSTVLSETRVYNQHALWIRGTQPLQLGSTPPLQLVNGNTLFWAEGGITYRLETTLPLEEALKIAKSFQLAVVTPTPVPPTPRGPTPTWEPSELVIPRLAGGTTLDDARTRMPFPIRLPGYPESLGSPDNVFVQNLGSPALILIWQDPDRQGRAAMALYELSSDMMGRKSIEDMTSLEETTVHGRQALWIRGPHMLEFGGGTNHEDTQPRRLVDGNVLLWEENQVTYRLETTLTMQEAVRVAESLR